MTVAPDPWRTPARRLARLVAPIAARSFPRRFGLFELLALGSMEWMRRHLAILNELESVRRSDGRRLRVLDFGGAEGALGRALDLYGLAPGYEVTVADIDAAAVASTPLRPPIAGAVVFDPAGSLPFADDSFDVAVSSDVFEHIPPVARAHWASELRRVAPRFQVHTVPCDSEDGRWRSTATDSEFQAWHLGRFGAPERWTAEHLEAGTPTVEELASMLAATRLVPIVNADIWLVAMKARFGPRGVRARVRFLIDYLARYRARANLPPYKNCLFVVDRRDDPIG